jgi:chemotaxis protein methyltransferase CheR
MIQPEERYFDDLCHLIYKQVGLDCKQYKVNYLKRRLAVRMRATKKKTYQEYEELLRDNKEEYEWLLDRLTINVSNFFRDPVVYDQMKKMFLPGWRKQREVRVWSAGCANGEEPYSISIILREGLPSTCQWEILATDIDPTVLESAKQGKYKSEALKTLPPLLRGRYFESRDDRWMIKEEMKKRIRFKIHDLTGPMPEGGFDLIICRNVLIYFVSELQDRLFKGFHKLLRPGGYLVLGKTETLLGDVRKLYHMLDVRERIYQKKENTPNQSKTGGSAI